MASFDIVSEPKIQEIDNALNQSRAEISQRYDFKGCQCEIDFKDDVLTLLADSEEKLNALVQVVHQKLIKRGVSLNFFDFGKIEPAGGRLQRQKATVKKGLDKEKAKEINKAIKESGLKVQSQTQGDQVRVTAKKIDDLQALMQILKTHNFGTPLEFTNYRS